MHKPRMALDSLPSSSPAVAADIADLDSVTIPAGVTFAGCDSVQVVDDDILEGVEDMTFTISSVTSVIDVTIGTPDTHTVLLIDNDGQCFVF